MIGTSMSVGALNSRNNWSLERGVGKNWSDTCIPLLHSYTWFKKKTILIFFSPPVLADQAAAGGRQSLPHRHPAPLQPVVGVRSSPGRERSLRAVLPDRAQPELGVPEPPPLRHLREQLREGQVHQAEGKQPGGIPQEERLHR